MPLSLQVSDKLRLHATGAYTTFTAAFA